MTKTKAIELAQRTANREGKPMAVLNLNPVWPLYVVRNWDEHFIGSKDFVARVEPERSAGATGSTRRAKCWRGSRGNSERH
jgi:hypothetical protein